MSSGHTPGPWSARKADEEDRTRWIVCVDGPKPFWVATIENGAPGDTLETEAANARLIAAAPELLKAAKAAREVLTVMFRARKDGPGRQAYEKLGAAIAKAEEGTDDADPSPTRGKWDAEPDPEKREATDRFAERDE